MTKRYRFVAINIFVSITILLRNVIFMDSISALELGKVAVTQTLIMAFGFLQFGLVSGSFIVAADRDNREYASIVNTMWGFCALLAMIVLAVGIVLLASGNLHMISEMVVVGLVAGLITIVSGWMNGLFVARGELTRSNICNSLAALASIAVALASYWYGFIACLISILVQPVVYVVIALTLQSGFRLKLTTWTLDKPLVKRIYLIGVFPFLAGLATLYGYQFERWVIVYAIDLTALGHFYPVIMFMTVFILVPSSLLNVHYPRAQKALNDLDFERFKKILRQHLVELSIYICSSLIVLMTTLPFIIENFLPSLSYGERYIYFAIPSLVLFVLKDIVVLVLYCAKDTSPILKSGIIFNGVYMALTVALLIKLTFSIDSLLIARFIAMLIATAYLFSQWSKTVMQLVDRVE